MKSCVIIEDDYLSAIDIKIKVEKIGLVVASIITDYSNIENNPLIKSVDIILSDVKLDNEVFSYALLKNIKKLPPIIFFTSYKDDKLYDESQKLSPYMYLLKPVDAITLKSAIDGALKARRSRTNRDLKINRGNVFVRSKGKMVSIDPNEIEYINSEGNYCNIFTNGKKIIIRSSLMKTVEIMNYDRLIQVHRSFAVNVNFILSVEIGKEYLKLKNVDIPIGGRFKKNLLSAL